MTDEEAELLGHEAAMAMTAEQERAAVVERNDWIVPVSAKPRPFPVMMDYNGLCQALADECDLCRNDGADDIAVLLNEAGKAIETLCAEVEEREEYVRRMYASINELVAGLECHGATKWMPHRVERAVQILNELRAHDEN